MFSRKPQSTDLRESVTSVTARAYAALDALTRQRIVRSTQRTLYQCQAQCYESPTGDIDEAEKCAGNCDPQFVTLRKNADSVIQELQHSFVACAEDCKKDRPCAESCVSRLANGWNELIAELTTSLAPQGNT